MRSQQASFCMLCANNFIVTEHSNILYAQWNCIDTEIRKKDTSSKPSTWTKSAVPTFDVSMGLFVSFSKHNYRTVDIRLSTNNPLQRQHYYYFGEVLDELYSSALYINKAFMSKQLDSNKVSFASTFIDVIQEFAAFLRKNNDEILEEIKMAIECQTFQPKGHIAQIQPIWGHLNQCVLGLFEEANQD